MADTAFARLFAWLGQHGIEPAGPPFIRSLEVDRDGEPLEIEVAAPVAGGAPEGDAQAALKSWTEQQGVVTGRGPPIEQDWTKRETELAYLVVDD